MHIEIQLIAVNMYQKYKNITVTNSYTPYTCHVGHFVYLNNKLTTITYSRTIQHCKTYINDYRIYLKIP